MTVETLFAFFVASTLLALSPGPDNIYVLTQSIQLGRIYGLAIVAGLATGLLFHTLLVAFGIAQIIATSPLLFTIIKFLGVSYLLYLAYLSWNSSAVHVEKNSAKKATPLQLYKRGIIMNVTNPKVTIFFLAFLPQFIAPDSLNIFANILILGFIFMISTIVVFGLIAFFAGEIGEKYKSNDYFQKTFGKTSALIFIMISVCIIYEML